MSESRLQHELAQYGPQASAPPMSLAVASAYCRRLARSHYENFTVASWLLPRALRAHFYHLYAYCRWADDLADEAGDPQKSLELLAWWEDELDACYAGQTRHPVFIALAETIREFEIPPAPFRDLLTAFRQDQRQTRYETFDDLLTYCRYSANPVGRLVLYLGRAHHALTWPLADSLCTGLQLANHWQDIARDFAQGRVYLPQEDLARFHVRDAMLGERPASLEFCQLLEFEVTRAEEYLRGGEPLVSLVPPALRLEVELFIAGGLAICEAIRRQGFDVLGHRPTVSKWQKLGLLAGAWRRAKFGRPAAEATA